MKNKCAICNQENWQDLDYLRNKQYWFDKDVIYDEKIGFQICKNCGFVTYAPRWTENELKKRYSADRTTVNEGHICAGNIKTENHKKILGKELIERINTGKEVLDIGCAFGHIRRVFPNANITGIEYSENMARYAKKANMVDVYDDLEYLSGRKFDLIMYYHVLEHVNNPRQQLEDAIKLLNDDGIIYIAVPTWFDDLKEVSGMRCVDFEHLYHLNHNNVFSYQAIKNLLSVVGLEVIKEDNIIYGNAFVCKKTTQKPYIKEDYRTIHKTLEQQHQAMSILSRLDPNVENIEALEKVLSIYPKYPTAWSILSVQRGIYEDIKKVMEVYNRSKIALGYNIQIELHFAQILTNWCDAGKTNNWIRLAKEMYEGVLDKHPGCIQALVGLSKIHTYHFIDDKKMLEYSGKAIMIDQKTWPLLSGFIGHLYCSEAVNSNG